MKLPRVLLVASLLLAAVVDATPADRESAPRFVAYDVRIDSGADALAAWQIEVTYDPATTKILSLEGGQADAFRDAPHYDPAGFTAGRIVIASFTPTDEAAPTGATRVARLHFRTEGEAAAPAVALVTAARPGGEKIGARATLAPATAEEEGR